MIGVMELLPLGVLFFGWLGAVVFLLTLAIRLVRAVEKIADTLGTSSSSA